MFLSQKNIQDGFRRPAMKESFYTPSLNLKFYITDHSPDNADTGHPERLKALYADIKKDSITAVRYDWHWNKVELEPGQFQAELLSRYSQAIELMQDAGLEPPTIIFSNIPKWALELYCNHKEHFFDAYRRYIEKVKTNLIEVKEKTGIVINKAQVLNELNNTVYTPIDGQDISRLCNITREVLHDYNPDIKLMGTIFAGNLPGVIKKITLGKINLGIPAAEYLEKYREILKSFDVIAIDYYPGMWHVPLKEARKNRKEIFKQLGLLQRTMEIVAGWSQEYELGEVGIQTNMPFMSQKHNQDRQRYFYDTFFRAFKLLLLDFQKRGVPLPTHVGFYEAMDEPPRSLFGKILRKITPFPEHDMGMRNGDSSRKEILKGNRHIAGEAKRGPSQLSRIINYINKPVIKDLEN